jgi:hypothetical protein
MGRRSEDHLGPSSLDPTLVKGSPPWPAPEAPPARQVRAYAASPVGFARDRPGDFTLSAVGGPAPRPGPHKRHARLGLAHGRDRLDCRTS